MSLLQSLLEGGGGSSPTGSAGGELGGTYPNPTILNSAVIAKVLTGLSVSGSSVLATDTILQAFGKLQNQINSMLGGVLYVSTWNPSTNTPTLSDATGVKGNYYVCSADGTIDLGSGNIDFKTSDWAIFNGTIYQKVDNTDAVTSVNGLIGAVVLDTSDIAEDTNLYFTQARVLASVLTGYVSGAGTISATDTILQAIQKLNGNIAGKQDSLGFTPEDVANKATDFSTVNNTLYPSMQAVSDALDLKQNTLTDSSFGLFIDNLDSKTTITGNDNFCISDSADSLIAKRFSYTKLSEFILASAALTGTPTAPTASAADNSTKVATTAYVDGAVATSAAGLNNKGAVVVATTAALPAYTYNNGTSGVGATLTANANGALPVQDGITLQNGDLFLVKDETAGNAPYNGKYVVTAIGDAGNPFVLTRTTDFDSTAEIQPNSIITITQGSTQADQQWWLSGINTANVVVGTDNIVFVAFSLGITMAGNGLTKSGLTISAVDDATGGANLAKSVNVSANGLAVKIDDTTIGSNGSNQLEVKDNSISFAKIANPTFAIRAPATQLEDWEDLDNNAPATRNGARVTFSDSADSYVWFALDMPAGYAGEGFTAKFKFDTSLTTGNVNFAIRAKAIGNDEDISAISWGTAQSVTTTVSSTANNSVSSSATSTVSIANTPVAGDTIFFQVYRDVSEDTGAGNIELEAIIIEFV